MLARKRAAEDSHRGENGQRPAGNGLRVLKRLAGGEDRKFGDKDANAASLLFEAWKRRQSAPRMLFRASNLGVAEVVGQLMSAFMHSPCPSPIVVEYLKETLVVSWSANAALVDKTIADICASEHCLPTMPFRFQAAVDICRTFLWNAWCKCEPDDPLGDAIPSGNPCTAVIPCLLLFLRGIRHWHVLAEANKTGDAGGARMDAMVERNMESCVAALRSTLVADLFAERVQHVVLGAPDDWTTLTTDLVATYRATASAPKVKPLWDELKTLQDPLQMHISSEPALLRDLVGVDLQSDDVTRRTLMLSMWSIMDRSEHSGASIESMALLMLDVRALQGSKAGHFFYNMWLSSLFILQHNSIDHSPERIVGRHFLLCHLPELFQAMWRLERHTRLTSSSPISGILGGDDSLTSEGVLEQAFARVRAWPQFLQINDKPPASSSAVAAPATGGGGGGDGAAAGSAPTPDVWKLVCDTFVDADAMTEKQVDEHIKPLANCIKPLASHCVGASHNRHHLVSNGLKVLQPSLTV